MKKLTIIQRDINTTGGYQPFVSNPTTPPFVAPLDNHYLSITYVAYAEWCGDNSSRNVKVSGVVGVTPIHWALTLGEQLAVTLPTSWEAEGFETGPVLIFVAQSATDRIILEADIIDISGTTATIIPSSIIQQSGNPAIENEEDSICFLQDLTPKFPPAAMLVRDGEEGTFYSSLNPNASAFGANPDTAWRQTWNNNGTYYYPTLPYWAQQWGVSYWPDIEVYNAIFSVGHFWPLQDGYDLQGTQNQDAYFGNSLRLLFGIKPNFYTHFPIRTAHVNCTESGAFTGGDVVLGGTQGAWTITTTPPTGATLLAEYLAVFNDEAANQGASQNTVQLLQTTQNTGTVFNVVAPNPQVVAVAVFQMPSGEYGVRVSNAISILPPPSPLVVISPAENTLQYAIGKLERLRPWDAIAFRVSADPSLLPPLAQHPYIRARWWAFVRNVGTGTTWMLEDAEFEYPSIILTPTLEGDATLLYQYVARLHTQLPAPSEADIFINLSQPLAEHHMRTYAAVYLTQQLAPGVSLAPTGTLPPQLEVCGGLLLETPSGVHYAECTFTVEINPYTTDGVWLNDYTWQSPPSPPVPPGKTLEVYWRLAQFA
ncbi:MAG: hypothetical protein N2595_01570, partial [bacterium]|nr:hypothetical protein [bacterium]